MHSKILNSGKLYNYEALGEDGKAIWKNADAFIGAVGREITLGKECQEILAIPKLNPNNEVIEWYIPFEPINGDSYEVTAWENAPISERASLLNKLHEFENRFMTVGLEWEAKSVTKNNILFSHFLTGGSKLENLPAIHFPGQECVFIVDGKPVITFWGFVNKGNIPDGSPFKPLELPNQSNSEVPIIDHADTVPMRSDEEDSSQESRPALSTTTHERKRKFWWLWWLLYPLLSLLLLSLLLYLLWYFWAGIRSNCTIFTVYPQIFSGSLTPNHYCEYPTIAMHQDEPEVTHIPEKDKTEENLPKFELNQPIIDENADNPSISIPLAAADVPPNTDADSKETESDFIPQTEEFNDSTSAREADKLPTIDRPTSQPKIKVPDENLQSIDLSGDDRGLDGRYRAISGLVESANNIPVKLEYNFDNGRGKVLLTQSNGVTCNGETTGDIKKNKLHILRTSNVKCTDGHYYNLPDIHCENDGNCKGVYKKSGNKDENIFVELYEIKE